MVHLQEKGSDKEGGAESGDPSGIEGVTEEFIVCLSRAGNDDQWRRNAATIATAQNILSMNPLVKTSRRATHLNQKEGMAPDKGA